MAVRTTRAIERTAVPALIAEALGARSTTKVPEQQPHVETLKLVKDWSVWLVGIDAGALAILGTILSDGQAGWPRIIFLSASICLLISLVAATVLVGAVPGLVQRVLVPSLKDTRWVAISERASAYDFSYGFMKVRHWSFTQHLFFVLAAILVTITLFFVPAQSAESGPTDELPNQSAPDVPRAPALECSETLGGEGK